MTAEVVACLAAVAVLAMLASARPRPRRTPGCTPGDVAAMAPPDPVAALEHVARDVRSGTSLPASLAAGLAAHPGVLTEVRASIERGDSLDAALSATGEGDEELLLHALRLGHRSGGSVADVIDRAVVVARERRAWRLERRAQAAQARLSAWLLTLLPVVVALWSAGTSARVRHAYATSPATTVATALGLGLNLTGWWWMQRLVRGRDA